MGQKRRIKNQGRLSRQIQKDSVTVSPHRDVEVIQEADTLDIDAEAYLTSFLQDFATLKPLGHISLLSQEDAKEALLTLNETQAKIERQLKTARALKRMLKDKSDSAQ